LTNTKNVSNSYDTIFVVATHSNQNVSTSNSCVLRVFGFKKHEFVKLVPEFVQLVPEFVKRVPEFDKLVPEFVKLVPEFVNVVPEFDKVVPEFDKYKTNSFVFT